MYYQVQKSACMQSSATVGRTDAMDYRLIAAWWLKVGVRAHLHLDPHCQKVRGIRTPAPLQDGRHFIFQSKNTKNYVLKIFKKILLSV